MVDRQQIIGDAHALRGVHPFQAVDPRRWAFVRLRPLNPGPGAAATCPVARARNRRTPQAAGTEVASRPPRIRRRDRTAGSKTPEVRGFLVRSSRRTSRPPTVVDSFKLARRGQLRPAAKAGSKSAAGSKTLASRKPPPGRKSCLPSPTFPDLVKLAFDFITGSERRESDLCDACTCHTRSSSA